MESLNPNSRLSPQERDAQSRAALLRLVRIGFVVAFFTVAALSWLGLGILGERTGVKSPNALDILVVSLVLGGIVFVVDYFTPNRKISTLMSMFVGLLVAMLATLAVWYILFLLFKLWDIRNDELLYTTLALFGIALAYLSVGTVLQTQDDFRFVIPYVEFAKQIRGVRPLVLDTSALIDGRIADVAATGFVQSPIVVPRFVIEELQALSDSQDVLKRSKGRRGLDVVSRLQKAPRLDVSIDERHVAGKATDQMLVELARAMPAILVTGDVGLSRVAGIQQVPVLNLNDLANALKQTLVPGESVTIKLLRQGEQATQAVGYLPDGTMVVAEDGAGKIGQTVTMTVTSSLQTSAGRMIFARIGEASAEPAPTETPTASTEAPAEALPAEAARPEPMKQGGRGPFGGGGGSAGLRGPSPRNPRR